MKHTQGPWKVLHTPTRKETFWAVCTASEAPEQAVIALIDGKSKLHEEHPELAEANAKLIAKLPEMFATLKQFVEKFCPAHSGYSEESQRLWQMI